MEFKDLKEKDDGICVVDSCISNTGETFETAGEFCSECEACFAKEQVTLDNLDEINVVRLKHHMTKIKE